MTTVARQPKPGRKAPAAPRTKRATKKDQLVKMLGSANGLEIVMISAKLGWQNHTTRAALTGLRKAGYEVVAEKSGQGRPARYRIVATPTGVAKSREIADAG